MSKTPLYEDLEKVDLKRSRAEDALRECEKKYRNILDGIKDSYLEVDLNGNFQFFNQSFCKLLGVNRNELTGRNNREFVDPENAEKIFQIFQTVYKTGNPAKNVVWEFNRKYGAIGVIEASISLVLNSEGEKIGFRGIGRDITERSQTSGIIRQSIERTNTILNTIQSGLLIIDAKTHEIIDVNSAAENMIGTSREDIVGHVCHRFVCPEKQGHCPITDKGQKVNNTETVLFRNDGGQTEILKTVGSVTLGGRECLIESFIDISERKRSEQAAIAHQERFQVFFSSVNDAIFVHPLKENGFAPFIEANAIACRRYGYSRSEFLNLTAADITKKEDALAHGKPSHRKQLRDTRHQFFEAVHVKKSGEEFPVEINANIVHEFGQPVILAVVRDISERKKVEAEKAEIESKYRQAQKVEAIGRLAGGVAHDLNNILSPIIGYGELLIQDFSPDDERLSSVKQIVKAGFRARKLVRQLLAFGRRQTLEYKIFDLNDIIARFETLLRHTIREDIKIEMKLSPHIQSIKADTGQIEQILMNLAVNAEDAMKKGGTLTIETAMTEVDEGFAARNPGSKTGLFVLLTISDTGCGMEKEVLEQIFEPFFSTKGSKGNGLGLATVYGIIKQHKGNIWVASNPEKGTTFTIYLPAFGKVFKEEKIDEVVSTDLKGTETILLVEDNEQVRTLTFSILKLQGYTVLAAAGGTEALEISASHNGSIDLLLTDVIMPDMNGKDLYERIIDKYPGIKVLYMSGYTGDVLAHHGILDQGIQFIQKPFRVTDLAAKIRRIFDSTYGAENKTC